MACIVVIALWCVRTADDRAVYLLREKLARQKLSAELLGEVQREGERVITVARNGGGVPADYLQQSSVSVDTRIDELHSRLRGFRPESEEQALLSAVDRQRHAYRAVRDELIRVNAAIRAPDVEKRLDSKMAAALDDYSGAIYNLLNHHSTQAEAAAMEAEQQFQIGRARLVASGMLVLAIGMWLSLRLALSAGSVRSKPSPSRLSVATNAPMTRTALSSAP